MKVDAEVDQGQDFGIQGVGDQGCQGAVWRAGKTPVDVLSIRHVAGEKEKAVHVDDGNGNDGSTFQLVEHVAGQSTTHNFNSVDFVAVQTAAQQYGGSFMCAVKHVHGKGNLHP